MHDKKLCRTQDYYNKYPSYHRTSTVTSQTNKLGLTGKDGFSSGTQL